MFGQSRALNRIAASITAQDICEPFELEFDPRTRLRDAEEQWDGFCAASNTDPFDHIALISKDRKAVGTVTYEMLGAPEETLGDVADGIGVESLVSAETPLLELAQMYGEKSLWVFIVLKGNHPIGWISYHHLLGPAFRSCLFGLILAVEQTMGDILKVKAKESIARLPPNRADAAKRIYGLRDYQRTRGPEAGPRAIIDCSNFIDKITMIESSSEILKALPTFNRNLLLKVESLRNVLAHPTPDHELSLKLPKQDLNGFIQSISAFEADLFKYLRQISSQ